METINTGRQRTRTKDRRSDVPKGYNDYSLGSPVYGVVAKAVGEYRSMTDWVVPRFAARQAKGEILMNNMDSIYASMVGGHSQDGKTIANGDANQWRLYLGDQSRFCTGWGNTAVGDYWMTATSLLQPSDINNTAIEACTRARSQIGRSNTDMWENLAERHKTIELLRSPIASWFKFEAKAKKVTAALSAAQAWLVYRYGIKPLVSSVNDVLKNYRKQSHPTRMTTRASAVTTVPTVVDTFETASTYWGTCKFTIERQRTHSYQVRAMSIDEVVSEFEYTHGLASKQLLTLPWELIPYSFVVDWLANVGDFVGALAQSLYPSSLGQCHAWTNTYSEYRRCLNTTSTNPVYAVTQGFGGWTRIEIIRKGRTPGLLGPGIVLKQNFRMESATRAADSFALMALQVDRHFKWLNSRILPIKKLRKYGYTE